MELALDTCTAKKYNGKEDEHVSNLKGNKMTITKQPDELTIHEAATIFPAMSETEMAELVEDMRTHGQLEPVWITDEDEVVDGRHRMLACEQLDNPVICRVYGGEPETIPGFVVSLNLHRRHLSEGQRGAVATEYANMNVGGMGKQANTSKEVLTSQKEAAKLLNVSVSTVQRAAKVKSEGVPELFNALKDGSIKATTAADVSTLPHDEQREVVARGEKEILARAKEIRTEKQAAKKQKKEATAEIIRNETLPLPVGPFRVIAIDPPWQYANRAEDDSHRGRNQFPDMSVSELCALPVEDLAHDDCVLWLWTTNAFMREAFECLDAWGFIQKTILTWDKVNMGLGDYLRNVTEHCIMAVRGKPVIMLTNQTTLIQEKRREHSRKPDVFYEMVDVLCPGSKLEMFARQERDGWQCWGAESGEFNNEA